MGKYTFNVISDKGKWANLKSQWNGLLAKSEFNDIFLTWEWLTTWWEVFNSGELSIVIGKDDNKIIFILPAYIEKKGLLKVLRFIGTGESDYGGILMDKSYNADELLSEAFYFIIDSLKWDVIDINQISDNSPLCRYLQNNINNIEKKTRYKAIYKEKIKCVYMDNLDKYDIFIKDVDKDFLSQLRKKLKKLQKMEGFTFKILSEVDSKVFETFFEMHGKRWKTSGYISNFYLDKYKKFHSRVIEEMGKKGWLIFAVLKLKEEFLAFIYGFKYNGKVYYYIPAYNLDYAKYSVGGVTLWKSVEAYKNSDIYEIDLLRGEEAYKYNWTKCNRTNYNLLVYNKILKEYYISIIWLLSKKHEVLKYFMVLYLPIEKFCWQ